MSEAQTDLLALKVLRDAWFRESRAVVQTRPPLHKIEVTNPQGEGLSPVYTIWWWTGRSLRRVSAEVPADAELGDVFAPLLEADYQAFMANERGDLPF